MISYCSLFCLIFLRHSYFLSFKNFFRGSHFALRRALLVSLLCSSVLSIGCSSWFCLWRHFRDLFGSDPRFLLLDRLSLTSGRNMLRWFSGLDTGFFST